MTLSQGDKNVVDNIRFKHGEAVADYPDAYIASTWRMFSQSEDYPNDDKFLEWLSEGFGIEGEDTDEDIEGLDE